MTDPIRVAIADDHPVVRDGRPEPSSPPMPDVEVVAEATNGREAVRAAVTTAPDVLVMDLRCPARRHRGHRAIMSASPPWACWCSRCSTTTSPSSARCAPAPGATWSRGHPEQIRRRSTPPPRGVIFGTGLAEKLLAYFTPRRPRHDLPAADRPGAGSARTDGAGPLQCRHRGPAAQPQDRPQSHLQHLDQAASGNPGASHRPGPGRRPGLPGPLLSAGNSRPSRDSRLMTTGHVPPTIAIYRRAPAGGDRHEQDANRIRRRCAATLGCARGRHHLGRRGSGRLRRTCPASGNRRRAKG